jgi:alkanesulfonate monooxygenase SsuD/methylene tetrahydromethanopterin reductase-like flavin-dependent oxidoreductase (luciferase family)
MSAVRFGVIILPELPWTRAQTLWQRAEELGFDHAWTYDHLAWSSLGDSPWYGAIPTLTAAATVTERIRLGPLVASPNFRHPVAFAKELIALDDISGGRITVGIGAGGRGWDAGMLGTALGSLGERAARFSEFVELTDLLLREPAVSYQGRFYTADGARTYPGCVQSPRIPFVIAATGPKSMRVAATLGQAWVTTGEGGSRSRVGTDQGVRLVCQELALLEEACDRIGRDPASIERFVVTGPLVDPGLESVEMFRDTAGRYEEAGVTDFVVHWPRPTEPYAGDVATFECIFSETYGEGAV